jgi:hypothetical protein
MFKTPEWKDLLFRFNGLLADNRPTLFDAGSHESFAQNA